MGAITQHIDVAQVTLYAFWVFFAGLIFYLRREDRREGYPLVSETSGGRETDGLFLALPGEKTFRMLDGSVFVVPDESRDQAPINATATAPWPGAPIEPIGDPLLAGVGPGAWAERADVPDLALEGGPRIVPLRIAEHYGLAIGANDPRGFDVIGTDRRIGGRVRDLWIDRSETLIRYLEVEVVGGPVGASGEPGTVLLPMTFAQVDAKAGTVMVDSLLGEQIARAPQLRDPQQITRLEEDRIVAFYGAGHLYAEPSRAEAWL